MRRIVYAKPYTLAPVGVRSTLYLHGRAAYYVHSHWQGTIGAIVAYGTGWQAVPASANAPIRTFRSKKSSAEYCMRQAGRLQGRSYVAAEHASV